jgi:hypothetical protein
MLRSHGSSLAKVGTLIVPRGLFIFACVAIVAFSFWGTLVLLDRWVPPRWREVALPPGTPQSQLAALPALPDTRLSWLGIAGVNAQVVPGVAAIDGYSILRLIAVRWPVSARCHPAEQARVGARCDAVNAASLQRPKSAAALSHGCWRRPAALSKAQAPSPPSGKAIMKSTHQCPLFGTFLSIGRLVLIRFGHGLNSAMLSERVVERFWFYPRQVSRLVPVVPLPHHQVDCRADPWAGSA